MIWASTWRDLLQQRTELRIIQLEGQIPRPPLAITLTCACNPGYKKVWHALRYFWQELRKEKCLKDFKLEYWGVTEFNQKHTIPHFHFIVPELSFLRHKIVRKCWQTAQRWAGFDRIAFDVRVERVKAGIQAYLSKYLTKLSDGGKDEIPRRANWPGRYVRYSRDFFKAVQPGQPAPTASMRQLIKYRIQIAVDAPREAEYGFYTYDARSPRKLKAFLDKADKEYLLLMAIASDPASYLDDFKHPNVIREDHTYQMMLYEQPPDWAAIKRDFIPYRPNISNHDNLDKVC